jgi:tRNA(fMet)-specific endonuclease VapC
VGLVVDTNVFVFAERSGSEIDFNAWHDFGEAFISAVSVSELLVGVHRANNEQRRARRQAFVDAILTAIPRLDVTAAVARTHARLIADLAKGQTIGAHDALIGATAVHYGFALLTDNVIEFRRLAGLQVLPLRASSAT